MKFGQLLSVQIITSDKTIGKAKVLGGSFGTTYLAPDGDRWRALVTAEINFGFDKMRGIS